MDIVAENVSKHFGLPWSGLIEQCRKMKKEKPPGRTLLHIFNNPCSKLDIQRPEFNELKSKI